MKGIINLNKKDINGQPGETGLATVPKEERYKYGEGGYYEGKGLPSYCNRCGYKDEYGKKPFYNTAKDEKELKKMKDGSYYSGYCELDSGAKGYSHAYGYKKELAYDYHYQHGQAIDERDKEYDHYQGRSDSCGACRTGQQGEDYVKNNNELGESWRGEGPFMIELTRDKEKFNEGYGGERKVNDLYELFAEDETDEIGKEGKQGLEDHNPRGHMEGDLSVEEGAGDKQAFYNGYYANEETPTKENRKDLDGKEIFKDYDNKK